jgi:hypothetical protein
LFTAKRQEKSNLPENKLDKATTSKLFHICSQFCERKMNEILMTKNLELTAAKD